LKIDNKKVNYATGSELGKSSNNAPSYTSSLLYPIARSEYRKTIPNYCDAEFGFDRWVCYELSWLNNNGLPKVSMVELNIPLSSINIVESKSLKLYLNSFYKEIFSGESAVANRIKNDLSSILGSEIDVLLNPIEQFQAAKNLTKPVIIDNLNISCVDYNHSSKILSNDNRGYITNEILCSHLLRTNCPVTNQPDWGTLTIRYSGIGISHESLLRYIVSFREHCGFHEQCVELIYSDIIEFCSPDELTVLAQYTRRGGIEINPMRSNSNTKLDFVRVVRQ